MNDRAHLDPLPTRLGYRLRGELAGEERVFALQNGLTRIGSASSNDVVLSVSGISRHHALASSDSGRLKIEDLESKNGTLVNGTPADEKIGISPGDVLQLGPVRLTVEAIDSDDCELGLELDIVPSVSLGKTLIETTLLTSTEELVDSASLALVNGFLERLVAAPDMVGALDLVREHLGARAVAVVDWPRGGKSAITAVAGPPETLPPRHRVIDSALVANTFRLVETESVICGVFAPPTGEPVALVLWGANPPTPAGKALLETLVRLTDFWRTCQATPGLGPHQQPADSQLRFPEGHVRGEAPAMLALYDQLRSLVRADLSVLIVGETGVGKEHVARILHASSPRRNGPLVAVNCAAIPADLLEAEIFGVRAGVATGVKERTGRFLQASGGTLFLDEIGEMSVDLQAKLLRVLEEKVVHPLGGGAEPLDARVVTATNADLPALAKEGRFRRDLYFRIAGYTLEVPPLRERRQDLPRLIAHFCRTAAADTGKAVRGLTVKAMQALSAYSWPGNVRELEHEIRRLVYRCPDGDAIDSSLLSPTILHKRIESSEPDPTANLETQLQSLERRLILEALTKTGGNQTRAAQLLEVSRNGLAKRMKRLGIQRDDVL